MQPDDATPIIPKPRATIKGHHLFDKTKDSSYIFIVVNPLSGGNAASIFLKLGFNYLDYVSPELGQIKVYISDIRKGSNGNKDVFHILRTVAHEKYDGINPARVRVMAAGGDGTLMWTFSELQRHGVNRESVYCGIVPFGTGNDFANAAAAHVKLRLAGEDNVDMVKRLVAEWMSWKPVTFDLWNLKVVAQDDGYFTRIDTKTRRKKLVTKKNEDDETIPATVIECAMANYFSIGVESRIGIGFDRNRTDNAVLNRGAYAMEGVKKLAFHRTKFINNLIDRCTVQTTPSDEPEVIFKCAPILSRTQRISMWFRRSQKFSGLDPITMASEIDLDRSEATPTLIRQRTAGSRLETGGACGSSSNILGSSSDDCNKRGSVASSDFSANYSENLIRSAEQIRQPLLRPCVSLVIMNIPSFGGGLDLWESAAHKLGVTWPLGLKQTSVYDKMIQSASKGQQKMGDGKLEIVAFQSLLEFGLSNLQRLIPPHFVPGGWRIYQAEGKVAIKFRDNLRRDARIYFQVDGEFFVAHRLKEVYISRDSQMQVLVHPSKLIDLSASTTLGGDAAVGVSGSGGHDVPNTYGNPSQGGLDTTMTHPMSGSQ